MDFNDIYKKYKAGTATDKEKLIVMEELEKYKTLTDEYLNSQSDDLYIENGADEDSRSGIDKNEINTIKNREKKRNIKLISISVLIVCLLLLMYKFVAEPVLNKYVLFGPETSTISKSGDISDLDIEFAVFTSLFNPYIEIQSIESQSTGLGKYDLAIRLYNSDSAYDDTYEYGYVKNGKVKLNTGSRSNITYSRFFNDYDDYIQSNLTQKDIDEGRKEELKKLEDLKSKFTAARVGITLEKDIDMGKLTNYIKKYENLSFEWAAIKPCEDGEIAPMVGMDLTNDFVLSANENKKDGDYPGFRELKHTQKGLENYFIDLLQFQVDHKDLANRIADIPANFGSIWYEGVLDHVRENGVRSYGLFIKGNPSDILDFYQNEPCYNILVMDIMLDVS